MSNMLLYEELENKVAVLTINRPDKLNALNISLLQELASTLERIEQSDIRVVVITGAGTKAFVAGADLEEIAACSPFELWSFLRQGQNVLRLIEGLSKPVITAINGIALGGGFELALACSLRIAGEKSYFAFPEASLGLMPGFGGTQRLPKAIGKTVALEYLLTGSKLSAEEAYRLGLINKVVKIDELRSKALEMANKIANQSPAAVRFILQSVQGGYELAGERGELLEAGLTALCSATEDSREGLAAFKERRKPVFTGC
ncbi:enoyl-CoA hydratase/carnithine racemase [Desulfoscipio gibsoniae DSM 7213]|uniref:short-chain-enoyl-CoA hydratase n=2 Tax=Desulfoscipio gibsoniae TaxID=102134 RepID=R4KHR9_9FIRM|nr:enoyl-CoA hydratase/carnithine racemase [Desulfoscipio gibsoniae DSM 7213]